MVNPHFEELIMIRRPSPLVHRLVRVWRDGEYAQRRLFEIRTGISSTDPSERL